MVITSNPVGHEVIGTAYPIITRPHKPMGIIPRKRWPAAILYRLFGFEFPCHHYKGAH